MADFPTTLRYSVEHEWVDDGTPATVGVTSVAADALGDVVYLELPEVGSTIEAGSVVGEIESTKSVSELYSPVSGTVVEVNQAAVDDPAIVNADPFGAGWLFKVEVTATGDLLTAEEYAQHTA
ncbi:glycine cleavage system protein GcvH [Isoptericola variabilis]|uniref:Glycine cleavage system H protein n=1 Tax=Isoptericola variabilis (strain 225) TaxID=743718 RepID=F6FQR0_ISOV2|nr:glycine cleavage system protein GcvH [Isoptericola variabilis]AEG42875.1 Glycine cleavage system H protein [Isoptericola variabilis 225]TWH31015.1 glycine cleavage system H protein [Isoptericola variabilis J7]